MKFEILVEGLSDKTALWHLLPKILGPRNQPHLWCIRKHQGIGKLPSSANAKIRITDTSLLGQLPKKLKAYGRSLNEEEIVVVLVDVDNKDEANFRTEHYALRAKILVPRLCMGTLAALGKLLMVNKNQKADSY